VLLKADYGFTPEELDAHIASQGFVDVKKQPLTLPIGTWHTGTPDKFNADNRS
jgi:hypothetical protein